MMNKKILTFLILCLTLGLRAQEPISLGETLPSNAIMPGYRTISQEEMSLDFNPFEPVSQMREDTNSEEAKAMLKRIKGYVVQTSGAPLLIIDGKSYKVGDKIPMDAAAQSTGGGEGAAAPAGGNVVTIVNITSSEAVFRKDDESGFAGETFRIFFNFSQTTNEEGQTNYNLWEAVGNGFFVNNEGLALAPLGLVQAGEISVLTSSGYSKATLVANDNKRGIALLKVEGVRSIPLMLASEKPKMAECVFPVGYPFEKKSALKFLEGFVREEAATGFVISPAISGELVGAAVLNAKGEVSGILIGETQTLTHVITVSSVDPIFKKYMLPEAEEEGELPTTRTKLEQSVVKIFKKK